MHRDPVRFSRRVARGCALLYALLIVLVSLVPSGLDLSAAHLVDQLYDFARNLSPFPHDKIIYKIHALRDLSTNFVLYLPLGLLVPWGMRRHRRRTLRRRVGLATAGFALSLAMELLQVFTTRHPWLWDVLMNGSGYLAGYLLSRWVIARYGIGPEVWLGRSGGPPRRRIAAALRMLYVVLLGLASVLPPEISVSTDRVWRQLTALGPEAGRIWLNPFGPWPADRLWGLLLAALLMIPYGFLARLVHPEYGRRALIRYGAAAAFIQLWIEIAQVFVLTRTTDVLQVLMAIIGAAVGVAFAGLWDRLSPASPDPAITRSRAEALGLLAFLYALVLMVEAWRPFEFVPRGLDAARKLYRTANWVPLQNYLVAENRLAIFADFARETGVYIPFGLLLCGWFRGSLGHLHPVWRFVCALGVCALLGAFLELGQAMVVGRYVDATDLVSHLLGAVIGYLLGLALRVR